MISMFRKQNDVDHILSLHGSREEGWGDGFLLKGAKINVKKEMGCFIKKNVNQPFMYEKEINK